MCIRDSKGRDSHGHSCRYLLNHLPLYLISCSQHLNEKFLQVKDFHTFIPDQADKRFVFLQCPVNPQDVIKQEVIVVDGCKPPETELRLVNHHLAKISNF